MLLLAASEAGVTVEKAQIRSRKGELTDWVGVRMDSGRKVFEVRFDGHSVGLGPGSENWYGNGFLKITLGPTDVLASEGGLAVVASGPDKGVVRITWPANPDPVSAEFELRDGDNKLLVTLSLGAASSAAVKLTCYPSSFAGGYRPGKALRQRHAMTATRDIVLGEEHGVRTVLTEREPWVLFMDDHFDVAAGRGTGPCAALYFPHEVAQATALTQSYACYLNLRPKPGTGTLHVVLWEFDDLANAEAARFMKATELAPDGTSPIRPDER